MPRERITEKVAASESKKKSQNKADQQRYTDGFEYDKSKANHLKKALHNINVSLGTLIAAMKDLSLLRGSDITPDGQLGGRGFIMPFREMKQMINESVSNLSDVTDTLADELTNPKWGLSRKEVGQVKKEKSQVDKKEEEADEVAKESNKESSKEVATKVSEEEIKPEDVKDSSEMESLKRYKGLLDGKTKDKVAGVLSKNILANLSNKGE